MSKLPSMPMFVDAYLADTRKLSLAERGAYTDILWFMWANGGKIRDDDAEICRMLGVSKKVWDRVKERLSNGYIYRYGNDQTGYFWEQKRLASEWNYVREFQLRQSEKGKRSQEVQKHRKQGLSSNGGSFPVETGTSTEINSGSNRKANRNSTPIPKEDIITSLQDAAREETYGPPEEKNSELRAVASPLIGAPARSEPTEGLKSYLLETGIMRGETPFLPKQRRS